MSARSIAAAAITAIASGLLFLGGTGLGPWGWLAWVAALPVFLFAHRAPRAWHACAAGFAAYLIGQSSLAFVYRDVVPLAVLLVALVVPAAVFAAVVLLARASARLPIALAVLAPALAWTSWEYLLSLVSPHGTAGAIGYAHAELLPIVQLASVTGVWGLSFLTVLVPSALAIALARQRRARPALLTAAVPLALALVLGFFRLAQSHEGPHGGPAGRPYASRTGGTGGGRLRVGLGADDRQLALRADDEASSLAAAQAHADLVHAIAARAAEERLDLIVLPEKAVVLRPAWTREAQARIASAAAAAGTPVLIGLDEEDAAHVRRNVAALFDRQGNLRARYIKRHLVPGLEDAFTGGHSALVIDGHGIAICKDLDFTSVARDHAGARALLVPAWDFGDDARLHARMALVRAVESGTALVRAAQEGLLTVADRNGRIVAEEASRADRPVLLTAEVSLAAPGTFYAAAGDLFAWLVLAMTALTLLLLALRRRPRAAPA